MKRTIIFKSLEEEKQKCYNEILRHQKLSDNYLSMLNSNTDLATEKYFKSQLQYHNEQLIRKQLLMSRLENK